MPLSSIPRTEFSGVSIATSELNSNLQFERQSVPITVATTGATTAIIIAEKNGTLGGFRCAFTTSLAANDTNYISWAVQNQSTSTALAADNTGGRNTTKATGGTAVTANTPYGLTIAGSGLAINAGDVITVTATVTGTLGATLSGTVSFAEVLA